MAISLKARLVLALLALAAAGLAVLDVVSYSALRSYLFDRVDEQVAEATMPLTVALSLKASGADLPFDDEGAAAAQLIERDGRGPQMPPGTFGELRDASGETVTRITFSYGEPDLPRPRLPADLPAAGSPDEVAPVAVEGSGGSGFRAAAIAAPGGETVVVAVPLTEAEQTLDRLLLIEIVVTALVLAALAAVAWSVVRVGLRPLERIEGTARAIAAGDLSRRVEQTDERTVAGRLGIAFNEMLVQIEQAFTEREASEERLRTFLADASHELRTPLSSIRGYAELFRLGAARNPDDLAKAMARIEGEAARMSGLVDDLLTLARLDRIEEPAHEPVDLASLVGDAAGDARVAAPERDISLDLEPVEVSGDEDRLRQLVSNLIANALDHTPAGTPIEVSVAADGALAKLEVRDHGAGLPDGPEEQVFERLWTGGSGGVNGRGTGLGLAIARAVAAAHDGEISAANAAGGGAVFAVALPRRDGPGARPERRVPVSPP